MYGSRGMPGALITTAAMGAIMWEFILPATLHLFDPLNIFLMVVGLAGGIIIGALPGLSATMGVALMVPVTFAMPATSGLIMLGAIYAGAIYGGANSAILICTPGTPSSVATTFDGWPLCQKGRADIGLYASLLSSAFGGIVGTLFLLFLAASLARFALQFGGPESFWLCLFGLSTIAAMTPDNIVKGIISGAIGILVSTIGLDPNSGSPRFTFGVYGLMQGVSVIPCMIGLFSFSQVLYLIGTDKTFIAEYQPRKGAFREVASYLARKCKTILIRSSILGTWVGMLPGAGGEIASIITYNESKRWDKDPSRYGKGCIEGVAASESANNAVIGGSLIPMLTLGIPGSAVAAVILGALMAHGIQPGFKIFTATGDLTYTFIMSQFAVNLLMIPVGLFLCRCMAKLLSIRLTLVAIGIVVLAYIGAYAINNNYVDFWVVFLFGLIGFFGTKVGMDTGAMALGVILGPMIEENLGKSVDLSRSVEGGLGTLMFQGTINKVLIACLLLSLLTPALLALRNRRAGVVKKAEPEPAYKLPINDILCGVAFIAFAGVFFLQYGELTSGVSRVFPEMLMSLIGVGGAYLLVKGVWKKFTQPAAVTNEEPVAWKRVGIITVLALAYVSVITVLGFYTSTSIFIFIATMLLGDRSGGWLPLALKAACFGIAFSAIIWGSFTMLLDVPTPEGLFI